MDFGYNLNTYNPASIFLFSNKHEIKVKKDAGSPIKSLILVFNCLYDRYKINAFFVSKSGKNKFQVSSVAGYWVLVTGFWFDSQKPSIPSTQNLTPNT